MGVDFIKFIHISIADCVASHLQIISGGVSLQVLFLCIYKIYGAPGSQSPFKICVIVGFSVKIHQPPQHLG